MAPRAQQTPSHVPPSATKTRLLQGLGFNVGDGEHEAVYLAIKADTERGYAALTSNRQNLKPQSANHQGRWTYNIVIDDAIKRTIRQIEESASPQLRGWYQYWGVLGTPRNFVIDWFLWHAFRNKDPRNKRQGSVTNFHDDDDEDSSNGSSSGKATSGAASSGTRYDPVRNGYV